MSSFRFDPVAPSTGDQKDAENRPVTISPWRRGRPVRRVLRVRASRSNLLLYTLSLAIFFGAWTGIAHLAMEFGFSNAVPTPSAVLDSLRNLFASGEVVPNLLATLRRLFAGFLLAELFGVLIGIVLGLNSTLEKLFDMWIPVLLTTPSLAYAIFALLAFGLNEKAIIFAVAISTFPYILVNIIGGVKAIDTSLLQMARVFRSGRLSTMSNVVLPQVVPYVLSSSRYGLGIAWKTVVVIELLGASSGVGYQLNYSFSIFSMSQLIAWVLVIVVVMLVIEVLVFRILERFVFRWRPKLAS